MFFKKTRAYIKNTLKEATEAKDTLVVSFEDFKKEVRIQLKLLSIMFGVALFLIILNLIAITVLFFII